MNDQAGSVHLSDLTAKEVREGGFDAAVLPVAATEYHGDHFPFSADTITATALGERCAQELGTALVLPAVPYGVSRLLVVSAHDGNPAPIENGARLLADRQGIAVALLSGWQGLARQLLVDTEFDVDLDHGGSSELSMVLHLRPELAHPERAVDLPRQRMGYPVRLFGSYADVSPSGYSGAPSRGSAAQGAAILDAIGSHVGPFLRELAANGWRNGPWMSGIGEARRADSR